MSLTTLASTLRRVMPTGEPDAALRREWLVTNGLGGYASATVAGVATRRYHGLLVAALPNPHGRTVMLNHLVETVVLPDGQRFQLSGQQRLGPLTTLPGMAHLREFRLDAGLPVWTFGVAAHVIEKSVLMPHQQNTTVMLYRMLEGATPVQLELRPALHFRHHADELATELPRGYRYSVGEVHEVSCDAGPAVLRLRARAPDVTFQQWPSELAELHSQVDSEHRDTRGDAPGDAPPHGHEGRLWSPGVIVLTLPPGQTVALVASTESVEVMNALSPEEAVTAELQRRSHLLRLAPPAARTGLAAELVLAADQFIVTPAGRPRDAARARAEGGEIRSVIAGYHWFTDWGRDTMISLEGLTLCTGRSADAASILLTFAQYVREGLLPNLFPDGSSEGLYHTADATLWFFHALDRYHTLTGDDVLLARLLPTMVDIAGHHAAGTRFGIGVDPQDGLLRQGVEGYQLTWMDARHDGEVITPRRGKAVEINALWFNALRVLSGWLHRAGRTQEAEAWTARADQARASFNQRFWFAQGAYLYDVVDGPQGNNAECRPNQLFAISLPHPVLDRSRWAEVLQVVRQRLLTPMGLRSLAPGSANYAPRYFGSLKARDAAYHQGTVWAWLIGPWLDAWRKQNPGDSAGAHAWLAGLSEHLGDYGIGSVAEVFDAETPYTARGCIAQAWSVAELLRQWLA